MLQKRQIWLPAVLALVQVLQVSSDDSEDSYFLGKPSTRMSSDTPPLMFIPGTAHRPTASSSSPLFLFDNPAIPVPSASEVLNNTNPELPPLRLPIADLLTQITRNPMKSVMALAEDVAGQFAENIPGDTSKIKDRRGNPLDILNAIEAMQKGIDRIGKNEECKSVLVVVDHSVYTAKELINTMNAVQKLGDLWSTVNLPTISKCLIMPNLMQG